jgi:predicted aminopeptidase
MREYGRCPAFGYECEYVAKVEAQAAEIERLREALTTIRDRKWNTMTQGCDAACAAFNLARAALTGKAEQ